MTKAFGQGTLLAVSLLMPFAASAEPVAIEGHEAAHAHTAQSGLPQLNAEFYPSQIFWLLVTGILMYLIMSKIALPKVARMIDMRDDTVRADLEQASRLRLEAEDIKVMYSRSLRDADERSKAMVDRIVREIKEKQAQAMADSLARISQDISAMDQSLQQQKDDVLKDTVLIARQLSDTIINELGKQAV